MSTRISRPAITPSTLNTSVAGNTGKQTGRQQTGTDAGDGRANLQQGMDKAFAAMQRSVSTSALPPLQAYGAVNVPKLGQSGSGANSGNAAQTSSYAATATSESVANSSEQSLEPAAPTPAPPDATPESEKLQDPFGGLPVKVIVAATSAMYLDHDPVAKAIVEAAGLRDADAVFLSIDNQGLVDNHSLEKMISNIQAALNGDPVAKDEIRAKLPGLRREAVENQLLGMKLLETNSQKKALNELFKDEVFKQAEDFVTSFGPKGTTSDTNGSGASPHGTTGGAPTGSGSPSNGSPSTGGDGQNSTSNIGLIERQPRSTEKPADNGGTQPAEGQPAGKTEESKSSAKTEEQAKTASDEEWVIRGPHDGKVTVKYSDGTVKEFESQQAYEDYYKKNPAPGTTSSEGNTTVEVEKPKSDETKKQDSSTKNTDSDAGGYNFFLTAESAKRSGSTITKGAAPYDRHRDPDVLTGPSGVPDDKKTQEYVVAEDSTPGTITRGPAPYDPHQNPSTQEGPAGDRPDPGTQQ